MIAIIANNIRTFHSGGPHCTMWHWFFFFGNWPKIQPKLSHQQVFVGTVLLSKIKYILVVFPSSTGHSIGDASSYSRKPNGMRNMFEKFMTEEETVLLCLPQNILKHFPHFPLSCVFISHFETISIGAFFPFELIFKVALFKLSRIMFPFRGKTFILFWAWKWWYFWWELQMGNAWVIHFWFQTIYNQTVWDSILLVDFISSCNAWKSFTSITKYLWTNFD